MCTIWIAVNNLNSSLHRRGSSVRGWWLGAPDKGAPTPMLAIHSSNVSSREVASSLQHLDALTADARRLGVVFPERLLLQEGQMIYSGTSPVDVRIRGWTFLEGSAPGSLRRDEVAPWGVGGPCLVQSESDGLRLLPSSHGLHHRSFRIEVREGALVLLVAWSLPGPVQQAQLALGFEAPPPSAGKVSFELLRRPALGLTG